MNNFPITETILFWVCAPIMIGSAINVCLAKKPVHAIIAMLGVMIPLAILYIGQNASFLGIVQIVVYSGAILMMFLFAVMLIGTHNKDQNIMKDKTKKSLKIIGISSGVLFIFLIIFSLYQSTIETAPIAEVEVAIEKANPHFIAYSIFSKHYFTLHLAGILLVASAIGALLLVHTGVKQKHQTQKDILEEKMRSFEQGQTRLGQKTIPGVYASSNASNMENISGDTGQVIEDSIFESYKASGQIGKAPTENIEIIDGSTGEKL